MIAPASREDFPAEVETLAGRLQGVTGMNRRIKLMLLTLSTGGWVLLACPGGTAEFLASAALPVITQILTDVGNSVTQSLLNMGP